MIRKIKGAIYDFRRNVGIGSKIELEFFYFKNEFFFTLFLDIVLNELMEEKFKLKLVTGICILQFSIAWLFFVVSILERVAN